MVLHAGYLHWYGDYDAALRRAWDQHKDLLVVLTLPRSPQAARLIRAVQNDAPLSATIASRFVGVIITVDSRTHYPNEMYYAPKFPAVFFVDAAREISRISPCMGADVLTCLRNRLTQY